MPAFLKYDQTKSALFEIKPRHRVGLVNQNLMLTRYRGRHRRQDRLDRGRGRHLHRHGQAAPRR